MGRGDGCLVHDLDSGWSPKPGVHRCVLSVWGCVRCLEVVRIVLPPFPSWRQIGCGDGHFGCDSDSRRGRQHGAGGCALRWGMCCSREMNASRPLSVTLFLRNSTRCEDGCWFSSLPHTSVNGKVLDVRMDCWLPFPFKDGSRS